MGPKGDLFDQQQSARRDRELTDKYHTLNLEAVIGSMKKSDPDEDRRNFIHTRLMIAVGMLKNADKEKLGYNEVIHYVDVKILKVDRRDAIGLMIRAIANARLSRFVDAVDDAQAAIRAAPDDDYQIRPWLLSVLPAWRDEAEKYGV